MPSIQVFKQQKLIYSKEFDGSFHIYVQEGQPIWKTETELFADSTSYGQSDSPKYEHVWLIAGSPCYILHFVRPDWALEINDHRCQLGLYLSINIVWSKVSLVYNEYKFSFLFEAHEMTNDDTPLPQPVILRSELNDTDIYFPIDGDF